MALWDRFTQMLALNPWVEPLQERVEPDEGSLEDLLTRIRGARASPWRLASVNEALGVPAIFRAVTLISNVVGSLSLMAFRKGMELADDDRPRLIVRPNPFTTPREFFRETAYSMATRGEGWWWIAMRDLDGMPLSLIPINPVEITVTDNDRDPLRPIIEWRGREMPNEDMRQIKMTGEPGALRGKGPLQMCAAAVSVAVESQEWAANYFAGGGVPPLLVKMAMELSDEDMTNLKTQWAEADNNTPRFVDPGVEEVQEFGENKQGAQMLQAREAQNGDAARMFGIPGHLLDHVQSGSSITYQNREGLWGELLERCLLPDYLEPMEQAMSDMLSRSTVARFNTQALLRADIKTRYEVHGIAIDKGVYDAAHAQRVEGIIPGDIENAAVPLSPPQAIPTSLPIQQRSMRDVRCHRCARLVGRVDGRAELYCRHCKTAVVAA